MGRSLRLNLQAKRRTWEYINYTVLFAFGLALWGIACQIMIGWNTVDSYCTTLLAFSYQKYGFVRRGLLGSIYQLFCSWFPGLLNDKGAFGFMCGMTILYWGALVLFCKQAVNRTVERKNQRCLFFFLLFFMEFLIPTAFFAGGAFGRADLCQMVICLLQIYLIIERRMEWLTIPLTSVNVLFHEGYLCMTFAAVLIILIYRLAKDEGAKRKYLWLLIGNIIAMAIPAVISVACSRNGTIEEYEQAYAVAESLNSSGAVHYNLLSTMCGYEQNVILTDDSIFKSRELLETPVFLVIFLPVLIAYGKFIVGLFRHLQGKKKGVYLWLLLLGPALISVEFIVFCDFGRYVCWLCFYYFASFISLYSMGDEALALTVTQMLDGKKRYIFLINMIYQPLLTTSYCAVSSLLLTIFKA